MLCIQKNTGYAIYYLERTRRPAGDTQILDAPRREVVHPPVYGDVLARSPGLLDGFSVTDVVDLAFDVFVYDAVEDVFRRGGREVEGRDELGEGCEPAGEGGGRGGRSGSGGCLIAR